MAKRATAIKRLPAAFFENESGRMPVREWLLDLPDEDRKVIGDDIRTAEYGWPIGMPICKSMPGYPGLWEIRSNLSGGRTARVLFCIHSERMVLLHGFLKTTQKTPIRELEVAATRQRGLL